jgi:hypothetical protein
MHQQEGDRGRSPCFPRHDVDEAACVRERGCAKEPDKDADRAQQEPTPHSHRYPNQAQRMTDDGDDRESKQERLSGTAAAGASAART